MKKNELKTGPSVSTPQMDPGIGVYLNEGKKSNLDNLIQDILRD